MFVAGRLGSRYREIVFSSSKLQDSRTCTLGSNFFRSWMASMKRSSGKQSSTRMGTNTIMTGKPMSTRSTGTPKRSNPKQL